MLEHVFLRTGVLVRLRCGPLGPYLDDLTTSFHHQGYAPSSIQRYLRAGDCGTVCGHARLLSLASGARRVMRERPGRGRCSALPLPNGLRIRHVDGFPLGEGEQLVDGQGVEGFVAASLGVTQVRGAQDILHLKQRMLCAGSV